MSRSSSSSDDGHMLLKSNVENLPLQRIERRRANLTFMHFFLIALLSSTISIGATLIVWKALRPEATEPRSSGKFLPGLDIPPCE